MEIEIHLRVRPVEDRIGLHGPLLLFDEGPVHPRLRLRTAKAAEPYVGPGFPQRAVHRLDLGDQPVTVGAVLAVLPELPPQRLHPRGGHRRLIGPQVEVEHRGERLCVLIGLGKQETGVDEHDRDLRRVFVNQPQHHRRLKAEAGGCDESVAELFVEQAQPLPGAQRRERGGKLRGGDVRKGHRGRLEF